MQNLRKDFANNLSTDIRLSKMIKSGGDLGKLLGPLLKTRLPLMKSVIKPLAKNVLVPSGLTVVASASDAGIHKKNLRIWNNNSNNYEMEKWRNYENS